MTTYCLHWMDREQDLPEGVVHVDGFRFSGWTIVQSDWVWSKMRELFAGVAVVAKTGGDDA